MTEHIHSNNIHEPDSTLLLAYIRSEATPDEVGQVEAWCREDAAHEKILLQISSIYFALQRKERIATRNPEKAFEKVQLHIKQKAKRRWINRFSVAAACIAGVILLSTAISYWRQPIYTAPEQQLVTVRANAGMRSHFDLPDGTTVYLNSGSSLTYPIPYSKDKRNISLEGEGYFKVAHNPNLPFIVSIPGKQMQVEVTGTEFNLQAYAEEDNIQTTLVNGQVNLLLQGKNHSSQKYPLSPSEKATYNPHTHKVHIEQVDTRYETAWIEGKLMFKDTPLPEVFKQISIFYNVKFEIIDQVIDSYCFTGTFDNLQLFQVLDYLKISSLMDYKIHKMTKDDNQNINQTVVTLWKQKR